MKRFIILLSFLLTISTAGFCHRYQLLETDEEENTAYLGLEPEAFEGIDLFLQIAIEDQPKSTAYWEAFYYGYERVTTVPHNDKYGVRYRIPKGRIFDSIKYPGMRYFDLIIHGVKPGVFGKTRLGKFFEADREDFYFIERFYFNEYSAMAHARKMPYSGKSLLKEVKRDLYEPLMIATMLPYDTAYDNYVYRVAGLTFLPPGFSVSRRAFDSADDDDAIDSADDIDAIDSADGVDAIDSADGVDAIDSTDSVSQSYLSNSQYSPGEILSTLFALVTLVTAVTIDPMQAITNSPEYELLYSLGNQGVLLR